MERLRTARERRNLTQRNVAQLLNKPQSFVAKCEQGERRVDAMEAVDFAVLYGVSLDQLLIGPLDASDA